MVGRSGEDHERSRSLRHPSSSSESPLPPIIRHHYSSEDRSDSQRASRPFSVSNSPPTSSNSTPRREFGESHKLSSQTEWIRLPSVSHALQQYGDIRPREPRFSLVIRQQPRRGLAIGSSQMALRTARSVPLDPPPVCELLVDRAGDEQLLSLPEVFVRAQLVRAESPYEEVNGDGNKLEPLVGDTLQSAFSSRIDSREDQSFFVFKELGVRTRGIFRMRLDLYDRVGLTIQRIASVYTDTFEVHERRKHPGLSASSSLMDALVERGMKYKLRKSPPSSVAAKKRKTEEDHHSYSHSHHYHHQHQQPQPQPQPQPPQQLHKQQQLSHPFPARRDSWTPAWQPPSQDTWSTVQRHHPSSNQDRRSSIPSIDRPVLPSISQLYDASRTSAPPLPPDWSLRPRPKFP